MTIFSKIIAGQIPSYKIAENEKFIAFLDIMPLVKGHTLVVPKTEVDKIFDLPDDYLAAMLVFAKPIARAIEKTFDCNRCGISVVGLEVPHAHMHLIPINSADDLNFNRPKLTLSKEELVQIMDEIRKAPVVDYFRSLPGFLARKSFQPLILEDPAIIVVVV